MAKKWTGRFALALLLGMLLGMLPLTAAAQAPEAPERKYYLGDLVNAGKDTGFSRSDALEPQDPHYGWNLGEFFVSGYTEKTTDDQGNPVFLKNVGDKITLWFRLDQDIDSLNGSKDLAIARDTNGYDKYFELSKTDFGRGTLVIRYTDHENHTHEPVVYTDYLSALTAGAETQVELFEEGDYEIALNYEIQANPIAGIRQDLLKTYTNYRIFARFSVRNGNCMVFPFDTETGGELTNASVTENGFYLDLARSRYLGILVKKEMLSESADGLVEDTRFNRPARDGERYTDEGIYTITVTNRYTGQQTEKKIYVGSNHLLKAHVTSGLPVPDIASLLSAGGQVLEDGTLVMPGETAPRAPEETVRAPEAPQKEDWELPKWLLPALVGLSLLTGIGAFAYIRYWYY